MTTITITLENELEQWLKDYSREKGVSLEEATKGVLTFWRGLREKEDELLSGWTTEELRAEIQKGLDSGEATPLDFDDIKRRGRERLASLKTNKND